MIVSGLCSISFRDKSVDEIISLVKEGGIESIEWGGDVHVPHGDVEKAREVREKTLAAGLKINSYGSYYRSGKAPEGKANPAFEDVVASAKALGAKTVRIWAGPCNREEADDAVVKQVLDDINRCADMVEAEGMTLSYEYHGGTFTNTDESAQTLAREIDRESVKFYWQPPHHNTDDENRTGLKTLFDRVSNVHVFHWIVDSEGKQDRRLLEEGKERWLTFLAPFAKREEDTYAFLEFARDNKGENFLKDAAILKNMIGAL